MNRSNHKVILKNRSNHKVISFKSFTLDFSNFASKASEKLVEYIYIKLIFHILYFLNTFGCTFFCISENEPNSKFFQTKF